MAQVNFNRLAREAVVPRRNALLPSLLTSALLVGLLLGTSVLAGCGKGLAVPSTVPVTGEVTYKGKPLQGIRVTFQAQEETLKTKFIPSGQTGPDGKFKLSTGAPGNGAPPGTYLVTFDKPEIGSAASTHGIETEIDAFAGRYSDPAQSQWKVTIEDGENSLPPFDLK
jgi:hypothetical protein